MENKLIWYFLLEDPKFLLNLICLEKSLQSVCILPHGVISSTKATFKAVPESQPWLA